MFIATLFIISQKAKTKCPSNDQWINKLYHIQYNVILFGHKKKWCTDLCYNMNEPWKQCAK